MLSNSKKSGDGGDVRYGHSAKAWKKAAIFLGILVLPFIVLYWLVPGFSGLTIGNDYIAFPIQQQMELNYSMEYDSFPLYAPGFSGGQGAAALTLGQIYHPLSHLARHIPGYWDGAALSINTILRLLSIGVCHLFAFCLLRSLGLTRVLSLMLSTVVIYNLRLLDHFRYGASLENHTAFIMLCCLITLYFVKQEKLWIGTGIIFSSFLLITGGHPQIAYLGFLGAALVTLLAPYFVAAIRPDLPSIGRKNIRSWAQIFGLVLIGGGLASPYLLGFFFEFLANNTERAERTYEWSLAYQDSWGGALRNLYAPLSSDVTGAFGGSPVLLFVVILPLLVLFKQKLPLVIWFSIFASVLFFLICLGDATPLHYWVWEYFPLADKFRVPGRYSLLLIFPMFFVLVWLFRNGQEKTVPFLKASRISYLSLVSAIAIACYLFMHLILDGFLPESSGYTPQNISGFSSSIHSYSFYLGLITLLLALAIGIAGEKWQKKGGLGAALALSIVAQVGLEMRYGTWVVDAEPTKTIAQMDLEKSKEFRLYASPGYGMSLPSVETQLSRSIIEPRIARLYRDVEVVKSENEMWEFMYRERNSHQAVLLAEGLEWLPSQIEASVDQVTLSSATYNRLVFDIDAKQPVLMSTNIPVQENWHAKVDGENTPIYTANGNEVAVFIPKGRHQLELSYYSLPTVVGGIIASITFAVVLVVVLFRSSLAKGNKAWFIASVLPFIVLYAWYESFYSGTPVDTQISWSSNDFSDLSNIAYGKVTAASSNYNDQIPIYNYSGRAVDGDKKDQVFASAISNSPSWKIDFGKVYNLDTVMIYGLNRRSWPLSIWSSLDNNNFKKITVLNTGSQELSLKLNGMTARYIALRSDGWGKLLSFKEFEAYGAVAE